jgi:UDP-N-acetylmuramoyl-L-alanyl-D-glutamate--2,6-diaminopimelate ligase
LLGAVDIIDVLGEPATTEVTGVVHDSRAVGPGDLFCCVPGERYDGHDFAPEAVRAGASALLVERPLPVEVAQAVVADVRPAMAQVAAAFHGHPSRQLSVVGVTGTNGKTTTTHLIQAALTAGGQRCAVMGTLSGARTTPEAPELQAQLAEHRDGGYAAVAMEVSSHALTLRRVDATWFAAAVFTNLSHDHLDFHHSVEAYFRAKASLFDPERAERAVVNVDDPYGRLLLESARLPTRPFSIADAFDLDVGLTGSTFTWRGQRFEVRLGGLGNVANALAAATAASELGVEPDAIAAGIAGVEGVPGRFDVVEAGQPFAVLVDYAHTPAALEHVLQAAGAGAAEHGGRVLVVFGCGGDRDRAKRPAMGEAAARLADVVVLTSDNPRGEDPAAILEEVRAGAVGAPVLIVEPDRRQAIATALATARAGDVVVIAGKGHEREQIVGDLVIPFDDAAVAREALASR